ncbi:MAG: OsmC family protein [Gemmatimonadaceae bacterium]|nr:OsmC family protein [Gemmatimonadaceae bacterium]
MKHEYKSTLVWEGGAGGTADYATYDRSYRVSVPNKPEIAGSADAMFKGDASKLNPEDLFVAAISSCHLLSYLALCARNNISIASYEDDAAGTINIEPDWSGKFTEVVLRPRVTISSGDLALALKLHETAHHQCFIANSCSCTVRNEPAVTQA